jgi:hypothetical protein
LVFCRTNQTSPEGAKEQPFHRHAVYGNIRRSAIQEAIVNYRSAVFIVLLCATTISVFAQAPAPEKPPTQLEQTLIDAEKKFVAAAKKGDEDYFKHTLTNDFSFVNFDGDLSERQDMIDGIGGGGVDLLPYDMKVVSVTDDVAIVSYDVVFRVPPAEDQGPPPRYQHFSTVWVKQSGEWKMKFQQMTASHWGDW